MRLRMAPRSRGALSRPTARLLRRTSLLQWILLKLNTLDAIPSSGVRTPALGIGELLDPPSMQQSRQPKVSLDAARLRINSVLRIALAGELLLGGPRPCPLRWIVDRDLVAERPGPRPRPTLDQVQVFTRPLEVSLRAEIRHVDDEGVALPVPAGVAVPLADPRDAVAALVCRIARFQRSIS
jgi:hypothetical protein